jgi:hypothetical protein
MKKVLFFTLILIFSFDSFAQNTKRSFDFTEYGVRIEPDRRLIIVMASLEAAGVNTPLTAQGEEFRRRLNTDLAGLDSDLRAKLANFVNQYKKRHAKATDAQIIAPFISMAYTLSPAPDLIEPNRTEDLPGDLLDVLDYSPLVREFYRKANFGQKIDEYVKLYQKSGDELRPSTSLMIRQLLDYMHTRPQIIYIEKVKTQSQPAKKGRTKLESTEKRERERRFFIVPEMLAAKGTINFVNVGDDYFAIVPPSTDLTASEVRRAYLQFVLDPVVLDKSQEIFSHRDAIKTLLDTRRKINPNISPDFVLAVSRSLVSAVDVRQIEYDKSRIATFEARQKIAQVEAEDEKLKKEGKFDKASRDAMKQAIVAKLNEYNQKLADESAVQLSDAYESGAVLAFYFADKLKGMEDSGFDITESVGNIIAAFDASKETNRLEQVAESRKRGLAEREERRKLAANAEIVIENPLTKKLLEIDETVKNKKYDEARTSLENLLRAESVMNDPNETARVYYSLGRIESLSAEESTDAENRNEHLIAAKQAYSNVIKYQTGEYAAKVTDKALTSLAYVALGRIFEFNDQNEYAMKIYEAAIKVGNVTGGAFQEAKAAHDRLAKNQ